MTAILSLLGAIFSTQVRRLAAVKRGELQAKGNRRLPPVFRGQKRRISEEKEMEERERRKKSLLRSRYKRRRRRRRRHHMCSVVPAVIAMVVQQGREPRMYCIFLFTFPILRYITSYLQLLLANSSLKTMCVRHSKPCDRFLYPWFIAKNTYLYITHRQPCNVANYYKRTLIR